LLAEGPHFDGFGAHGWARGIGGNRRRRAHQGHGYDSKEDGLFERFDHPSIVPLSWCSRSKEQGKKIVLFRSWVSRRTQKRFIMAIAGASGPLPYQKG